MEDQDQIDLLAERVKGLPYESLVELEQGPQALPIADNYRQIIAQAGPQIQAITQKQYQPSEELTGRISEAKSAYEKADQPQEQDMLSQAITSFMPAILCGLSGESGKIAQAPASKQARDLYEAQRKEQAAYKEKDKERALKRYEELVKSKQSEREAFDKAGQREIEGIKAGAQGAKDLASLDMSGKRLAVANNKTGKEAAKLSGEARGKVGAMSSSLDTLDQLESLYNSGEKVSYIDSSTPLIGGLMSDKPIDVAIRKLSDDIGRLRSGGAINLDEEARFKNMLPRAADKKEIAMQKIKDVKNEFLTRSTAYGAKDPQAMVGGKAPSTAKKPSWAL